MSNNRPNSNPNTLTDLFAGINNVITKHLIQNLFTVDIVEVESLAENNAFVNVKPVLKGTTTSGEVLPITENDTINNVCMMTLFGNGCEISFNVSKGDKGILLTCKGDISKYKITKSQSEMQSFARFFRSNGVFIPLNFETKREGLLIKNNDSEIYLMPDSIDVKTKDLNIETINANIKASKVNIEASDVNLGGLGGFGVARIGDLVAPDQTGALKIQQGSSIVKAI